jgi:peptidyl-prolyl cis-trans isomerase B (cyclophilin B)
MMIIDGSKDRALVNGIPFALNANAVLTYAAIPQDGKAESQLAALDTKNGKTIFSTDPADTIGDGPFCSSSPDGKQLVYMRPKNGIWIATTDHKKARQLTKDDADFFPTFTPDGKTIIFLRDSRFFRMNTADGGDVRCLTNDIRFPLGKLETQSQFSISPDGKYIMAYGISDSAIATNAPKPQQPSAAQSGDKAAHAAPTQAEIDAAQKAGTQQATISTAKGDIVVELYGKDAPLTVANFVKLVKAGFYDGLNFHRIEPGFVIQGGDPNGDGSGGPGYQIKLEIAKDLKHVEGALAMARAQDPDSAGSQFYITLAATPFLDGNYAVFGKVINGMDVVKKIEVGDKITKITIK